MGRSPHGERGLKPTRSILASKIQASFPSRGTGIETQKQQSFFLAYGCRSPHGERGLKLPPIMSKSSDFSRSPHGERGLKHRTMNSAETLSGRSPHGERGLKLSIAATNGGFNSSFPSRGTGIETRGQSGVQRYPSVVPLTGNGD